VTLLCCLGFSDLQFLLVDPRPDLDLAKNLEEDPYADPDPRTCNRYEIRDLSDISIFNDEDALMQ
jgi:hypothetical protein